jgi:hypothetical protein
MNGKGFSVLPVVFLLGLVAFPDGAQADDVSWNSSAGGYWSDAANWDSGTVPGALDNVSITVDGTYTVTLNVNATVASLTVGASIGEQALSVGGVTLALDGASSINSNGVLGLNGGVLASDGVLTVAGLLDWRGGTMRGTGPIAVSPGGLLELSGVSKFLSGVTIDNAGTAIWSDGRIYANEGAVINNLEGATFDVQSDRNFTYQSDRGTFNNHGLFRKASTTGMTSVYVPFHNHGTVALLSGTLNFGTGLTQTAGTTILNGGSLTAGALVDIQGGILTGFGNITGNVSNAGQVNPGLAYGVLSIQGVYTQTPAGVLNIEIGGPTPGTEFDRLNIVGTGGNAVLDGTLSISLIDGFTPILDDSFEIMTFHSVAGDFASKSGLDIGGGLFLEDTWDVDNLVLIVSGVPDNQQPLADARLDRTVITGETVQLDGSGSSDPDGDPLSYGWEIITRPAGSEAVLSDPALVHPTFSADTAGTYVVQLTVSDGTVDSAPDQVTITAQTPCPSIAEIWPPNHKMVDIDILGLSAPDGDPMTVTVTRITQDEPVDDAGDGHFEPDGGGIGAAAAQVRAERSGLGNGRVYTIAFTADDGQGRELAGSVTVCVPHDQGGGCVDDGQWYDSTTGAPTGPAARLAIAQALPDGYVLSQSYPNPANPSTQIPYQLPEAGRVSLVVYNQMGQQVRALVQAHQDAVYRAAWDGKDAYGRAASSGVYLYRLIVDGGEVAARRMLLLR